MASVATPDGEASVTWLHLSDMHLHPPKTGWESGTILKDLRQDLRRMQNQHGLRPDLIFFTGDLGFGHVGDKDGESLSSQLDEGWTVLTALREELSVADENVFLVPGNHDVNREKVTPFTTSGLDALAEAEDVGKITEMIRDADLQWQQCMERLVEYRDFLEKGPDHLLQDRERLISASTRNVAGVSIGIAGLNTVWSCGRKHEKGKLWLGGRWQIGTLKGKLDGTDFSILLGHHPPSWLVAAEATDVSQLLETRSSFFLHGHVHSGWIRQNGDNITIAAGAAYCCEDKESGYNLVRLFPSGKCEVFLRQYTRKGSGGWVPCVVPGLTDTQGRKEISIAGRLEEEINAIRRALLSMPSVHELRQLANRAHVLAEQFSFRPDVLDLDEDVSRALRRTQTQELAPVAISHDYPETAPAERRSPGLVSKILVGVVAAGIVMGAVAYVLLNRTPGTSTKTDCKSACAQSRSSQLDDLFGSRNWFVYPNGNYREVGVMRLPKKFRVRCPLRYVSNAHGDTRLGSTNPGDVGTNVGLSCTWREVPDWQKAAVEKWRNAESRAPAITKDRITEIFGNNQWTRHRKYPFAAIGTPSKNIPIEYPITSVDQDGIKLGVGMHPAKARVKVTIWVAGSIPK